MGVYVRRWELERILSGLERCTEEKVDGIKTIVGGDFNARTGCEGGGLVWEEGWGRDEEEVGRRFKNRKMDWEGKRLVKFIEEKGWEIFNGNVVRDEEGEYTFTGGRGNTVMDYIMGGREVKEMIERLKIGLQADSDHQTVEVVIKGGEKGRTKEGGGRRGI